MGTLAFAIHPRLRDEPLDARALAHARGVAADWRAAGLAVDLVEHLTPAGRQNGYVLTARSPTRVLRCECRGWRLRGWLQSARRHAPLVHRRPGRPHRAGGGNGERERDVAARRRGDGDRPRSGLAPGAGMDRRRAGAPRGPRRGGRPGDAEAGSPERLGAPLPRSWPAHWRSEALAAYGAWRAEPATNEVRSGPATAAPPPSPIGVDPADSQNLQAGRDNPGPSAAPFASRRPSAEHDLGRMEGAPPAYDIPAREPAVGEPRTAASAWRLLADRFPAERGTYRGDLDVMLKKGAVRVLTAYSKTDFFVDKGESGGVTYEYMRAFEAFLQKRQGPKQPRPVVYFVPVSRDRLIPALLAGEGDLVAANLTVTPERERQVDFSEPYLENVKEVVVTGPASPRLATLEDLAGKEVWVRRSSSYWASLEALGRRFAAEKRASLRLVEADEHLEDEDLLDMLNAGLIPLMVVDDHKAKLWAKMLPKIKVREDIVVREEGRIAFAIRKRSPKLKAALDAFVAKNEKGTTFGNIVFNRYLADTDFVKDAASEAERRKFEKVLDLFRRFG